LSLSTPKGRIGEWSSLSIHSQLKHQVEMSGSLHARPLFPRRPFRIIQIQIALSALSCVREWLTVYPLPRQSTLHSVMWFLKVLGVFVEGGRNILGLHDSSNPTKHLRSRDISVGIATTLRAGRSGDRMPVEARCAAPVQPALRSTQPPVQYVLGLYRG
jgi:hypothetical protein